MAYSFNYTLNGSGTFLVPNTQVSPDYMMSQWVAFNADMSKLGIWTSDTSVTPNVLRCISATGFTGRYNPAALKMTDYTFSAKILGANKESERNLIGVVFRYIDSSHYYFFAWDGGGGFGWNGDMRLYKVTLGGQIELAAKPSTPWSADSNFHEVKVTTTGAQIQVWVDGELVFDYTDTSTPYLYGAYGPFTGFQEASFEYMTGTDFKNFTVQTTGLLSIPESSADFASATYSSKSVSELLDGPARTAAISAGADYSTMHWSGFSILSTDIHATVWLDTGASMSKTTTNPTALIGSYTDVTKVPPSAPTSLVGTGLIGSIQWNWTNVATNADGIEILDEDGNVITTVSATTTIYQMTDLGGDVTKAISIRSYNQWGKSASVGPVSATSIGEITLYVQPERPTDVEGVIVGNAITWTWVYPTAYTDLLGFHIYNQLTGALIANAGLAARSFTQRNISYDTPYGITVKAYNKMMESYGADSELLTKATPSTPVPTPNPPQGFTGVAKDNATIVWSWVDTSAGKGRFVLYSGSGDFLARIPAGTTSYAEEVQVGISYQRYVTVVVDEVESAGSELAQVTTPAPAVEVAVDDSEVFDPNSITCTWLPKETSSRIPAFKSGIGDGLDLKVKVDTTAAANESFNYTMQLKAYLDQVLRIYPEREFKFRILATGETPVVADKGNFSARLTLWPRRQATVTLVAMADGEMIRSWNIPFDIWGYATLTVVKLEDYPVEFEETPATPPVITYDFSISGDSQVQAVWNSDQTAILAAASDTGLSAVWAGQVTIAASNEELCQDRIAVPAEEAYQNGRWTFSFISADYTVRYTFKSGAYGTSTVLNDSVVISMSQGSTYRAWSSASEWFTGTVNGGTPMTKNGDGYKTLQVPVELLLPNGLINLQYAIELQQPTPVKFYLQKGSGSTTTHADDVVTFYCDEQDNLAVPLPWYGVVTEGSGPYNVTESGLTLQELIPSPMKDPSALVYNGSTAKLKPLYNYSLIVTCDNPNVAISYTPSVDWAPDALNVSVTLQSEIINPTQTPWHPSIHNGYYYLNQAEHYLYADATVKGEVKTLNGFAPVSFTYSVGIDAVKDYPASNPTWVDTEKADFAAGQLQSVDIVTVPGEISLATDSTGTYIEQGTYVSTIREMPYAATAWAPLVVDVVNVGGSSVVVETRSRKDDGTWNTWSPANGNQVTSELGDAIQYQVVLNRGEVHNATTLAVTDQGAADFLQGEMTENTSMAGFGVTGTDTSYFDGSNGAIYTSRVFDIGAYITDMGTLSFEAITPPNSTGATVAIYTSTSDSPSGPWVSWVPLAVGGRIASPTKRYLRYQARFGRGTIPGTWNYRSSYVNDKQDSTNVLVTAEALTTASTQGVYTSKVMDVGNMASWGPITLDSTAAPVGGSVVLEIATGDNPTQMGSWYQVQLGDIPPMARYLQYRITINRGESVPVTQNFTDNSGALTHVFNMGNVKSYHGLTSVQQNTNGSSIAFKTQSSPDGSTWTAAVAVSDTGVISSPADKYLKVTAIPTQGHHLVAQDITDAGGTSSLIQGKTVTSAIYPTTNAAALDKLTYDLPDGLPDGASISFETSTDGNTWQAVAEDGTMTSPVGAQLQYRALLYPGFGPEEDKTTTLDISAQTDSFTSDVIDLYGKVISWDHMMLSGVIPDGAAVTVYTATASRPSDLANPVWESTNVVTDTTGALVTLNSAPNRYLRYLVSVGYAPEATPQATPDATPQATPDATPQATPTAVVWSSAEIVTRYQPFKSFSFNNVHMGWEKTVSDDPVLKSVTVSADTFTYVSPTVKALAITVNTFTYAMATLQRVTAVANTYTVKYVTPVLRSVELGAYLEPKEFIYSYSTSFTGQVASDMQVHQVSSSKLKDIIGAYLLTQSIDITDLNIQNYVLKHVDPSVVLSTSDYQYGTGYVMAQTTSTNPKPLINDAKVIYDYKTKSALVSPVPRQGAPVIVKDQRGYELRQVFFVNESGQQSLTNTEYFTADGVTRQVALKYQDVDENSIVIWRDPNKDGNWVQDGPVILTAADGTTTTQKNYALCNNTLYLPEIYDLGTSLKVTYSILDSFYVDYNYNPSSDYAKIYLSNCIPIVDVSTGLTTLDVSFETKDDTAYYSAEEINLNPMLNVIQSGFVYLTDTIEPAVKLEIYTNPDVLMATGYDKTTVIVMAKDRFGNPVIGETITFDAVDPSYGTRVAKGQIYVDTIGVQTAVTDEHGIARAIYLADSTPGNVILRVVDQTAGLTAEKSIRLMSPNVHARIALEADKNQLTRDGYDSILLTVTVVGVDQKPAIGEKVTLSTSAGSLSAATLTTDFQGVAYAYLTAATSVAKGLITVTAASAKYSIQQSIIINAQ